LAEQDELAAQQFKHAFFQISFNFTQLLILGCITQKTTTHKTQNEYQRDKEQSSRNADREHYNWTKSNRSQGKERKRKLGNTLIKVHLHLMRWRSCIPQAEIARWK